MRLFQRLGLGLARSLFSISLVVFALFASVYFVLDTPTNLKAALQQSGIYTTAVDSAIAEQSTLGTDIPIDNPAVQTALKNAFPASYVQTTSNHNIDATYDWIHGRTQKPDYSVNLTQPKDSFANNIASVVQQKLDSVPTCTKVTTVPTTPAEVLALTCKPKGVSTDAFVAAARDQAEQATVLNQIAKTTSASASQTSSGQQLADRLSIVPTLHRYYIISLYVLPAVLILTAVAILFWSATRRAGLKALARMLIVTGIVSIVLSVLAVWLLGRTVHILSGNLNTLIAVQSKILDVAHILGSELRNWWVGIGAGYIIIGIALLCITRLKSVRGAERNKTLNTSLGYSANIPSAGTMFDPEAGRTPVVDKPEPDFVQRKNPR